MKWNDEEADPIKDIKEMIEAIKSKVGYVPESQASILRIKKAHELTKLYLVTKPDKREGGNQMKYYSDRISLRNIYLSTDKEDSKGVLIISRETYVTLIKVFFGHLYMDDKMVVSGSPDILPEGEFFPYTTQKGGD